MDETFLLADQQKFKKSKEIVCQPSDATKPHKHKKVWVISWGVTPGQEEASQRCNKCVARPSQSLVSKSGALELDPSICCYFTNWGLFQTKTLAPLCADTGPWHSNAKRPLFPSSPTFLLLLQPNSCRFFTRWTFFLWSRERIPSKHHFPFQISSFLNWGSGIERKINEAVVAVLVIVGYFYIRQLAQF